jgi:hypothetical protein
MSELTNTMEIFSKLSHDLKNDFIIIRALAGNIKKQSPQSDTINKKIEDINNVLNTASQRLDTVRALLK